MSVDETWPRREENTEMQEGEGIVEDVKPWEDKGWDPLPDF